MISLPSTTSVTSTNTEIGLTAYYIMPFINALFAIISIFQFWVHRKHNKYSTWTMPTLLCIFVALANLCRFTYFVMVLTTVDTTSTTLVFYDATVIVSLFAHIFFFVAEIIMGSYWNAYARMMQKLAQVQEYVDSQMIFQAPDRKFLTNLIIAVIILHLVFIIGGLDQLSKTFITILLTLLNICYFTFAIYLIVSGFRTKKQLSLMGKKLSDFKKVRLLYWSAIYCGISAVFDGIYVSVLTLSANSLEWIQPLELNVIVFIIFESIPSFLILWITRLNIKSMGRASHLKLSERTPPVISGYEVSSFVPDNDLHENFLDNSSEIEVNRGGISDISSTSQSQMNMNSIDPVEDDEDLGWSDWLFPPISTKDLNFDDEAEINVLHNF